MLKGRWSLGLNPNLSSVSLFFLFLFILYLIRGVIEFLQMVLVLCANVFGNQQNGDSDVQASECSTCFLLVLASTQGFTGSCLSLSLCDDLPCCLSTALSFFSFASFLLCCLSHTLSQKASQAGRPKGALTISIQLWNCRGSV